MKPSLIYVLSDIYFYHFSANYVSYINANMLYNSTPNIGVYYVTPFYIANEHVFNVTPYHIANGIG